MTPATSSPAKRRTLNRLRGYRTCIIVATIARAGGTMTTAALRDLVGRYATNVIYGVSDVGFIRAVDAAETTWQLTAAGCELAEQLLGHSVVLNS